MGAFSSPAEVDGLATAASEMIGSLSPDELNAYLWGQLDPSKSKDVYVATRTEPAGGFGTPAPLPSVDTDTVGEIDPWISPSGLMLLFVTNRQSLYHIYVATRASELADFAEPEVVAGIQAADGEDRTPYVTADADELWFMSDRAGGLGGPDIWRAARSGSSFANPTAVTEVSSASADFSPVLSGDKLTIYVSSSRPGGLGGFDIWRAHRATTSDAFGSPELVEELNSSSDDLATWLSPDGCHLYLRSARNVNSDSFVATRSRPSP